MTPFSSFAEEVKDNSIHKNCRKAKDACVSMDINILDKSLITDVSQDTYTLKLFGKLDKKAEAEHTLTYQGKESCPSTALGTVAVLGFSKKGNPIIVTDEGDLELTSKLVTVGTYNFGLYNTETKERTPVLGRSATIDKSALIRIQFDNSGHIYFLDGFECFEFRKNNLFRKVDIKNCNNKKKEISDLEKLDFRLRGAEKAFELKDSRYVLIAESMCS